MTYANHEQWRSSSFQDLGIIDLAVWYLVWKESVGHNDHRVLVWSQSSHMPARRSDFRAIKKCPYHVSSDLDFEHTLDERSTGDHRVQVWSQSNHLPVRRSDFRGITKVPYHLIFDLDLDLDLEHNLDARSPEDHRVQIWSQSSHLCRSRSDLRKKFTERQTDRQTDRRRTPRDCISSWNERKIECFLHAAN